VVEIYDRPDVGAASTTPEMSVNFYQTTRRNIPEDNHFHTRRHENLKSHMIYFILGNIVIMKKKP
jgi:hypothetical protein